jgi:hypothetical protein
MTGILLTACMLLTGCGGSYDMADMETLKFETSAANGMTMDMYMEPEVMEEAVMYKADYKASASTTAQMGGGAEMAENDLTNRKLIRDANLNVETKTYDQFITALEQQIASHGAYVQNGENTGSAERGDRWASYTIRVPENRYTAFLSTVSTLGTVTYRSENVQDVTMEYTDVEARIRALETEHDTLLAILEKCENLDDVITVQSRITEVQYELDSYKSRMRRYDDLIAYCTVYLSVDEVEKVTVPPAEQTVGERIAEDLAENCEDIADDAEDFAVWFVSSLPYFGIWIAVIGGVALVGRMLWKRSERKLAERNRKRAETAEDRHSDEK